MLHTALRAPEPKRVVVDGVDVVPKVTHAVLERIAVFSREVDSGQWRGHTGKRICNVINIGIGGSDFGPVMAYEALRYYSQRDMTFRFVSNVDSTDVAHTTTPSSLERRAVRLTEIEHLLRVQGRVNTTVHHVRAVHHH